MRGEERQTDEKTETETSQERYKFRQKDRQTGTQRIRGKEGERQNRAITSHLASHETVTIV